MAHAFGMAKKPLKLYWWRDGPGCGNFGDELGRLICEELSRRPVQHASPQEADLIAIGSILEPWFWRERSNETFRGVLWGAGRMLARVPMAFPLAHVAAVRGYGTRRRLGMATHANPVVGDPGLLAPLLLPSLLRVGRRWPLGVIPHWSERDHPKIKMLATMSPDVRCT